MSITDELREWNRRYAYFKADLTAIADRIDAEHRAAIEKLSAMIDKSEDMYNLGFDEAADYVAGMVEQLEERVSIIERKLNHRGER